MNTDNPTAMGRWAEAWQQIAPEPTLLKLQNAHMIGPFDYTDYGGYDEAYLPERALTSASALDFGVAVSGKGGKTVQWRAVPESGVGVRVAVGVERFHGEPAVEHPLRLLRDRGPDATQLVELRLAGPDSVEAWFSDGCNAVCNAELEQGLCTGDPLADQT